MLKVEVDVPLNGSARIVLPGMDERIGSGKRVYEVKYEVDLDWPPKPIEGPISVQLKDECELNSLLHCRVMC